ncbi:DUF3618 domain-containing protein [Schaalia suimastitidis]|uniref:DUF3618 domain-containing protein n=1 Tax=Schaalia suimastitidis TaxID=121163 RepID=UPI0003FD87A2|nr:DUF3618 domain-containing protein [Schaalia suimastitidis]
MSATEDTRTAAQIEADLAATRQQMARTLDDLVFQLSPSHQIDQVKLKLTQTAQNFPEQARAWAERTCEKARTTVDAARSGDEDALRKVGIAAVATVAVVGLVCLRIFRRR